jgi:hypothetical protein
MKDILKSVGSFLLGICILVGAMFLAAMFIKGGVWLSVRVYPWLVFIAALAFWVTVLIFLPLAFFRRTRGFAGASTYFTSYVFGLTLWVWSLLLSYTLWGIGGVIVGLFLAGIGVVPVAMLASLFNGLWPTLGELVLLTIVTFGSRSLGMYIMMKAEDSGVAVNDAFSAASAAYSTAYDAIQTYTTRANHYSAILNARYELYKSPLSYSNAADAYDEAVAAYTDPADFAPYTAAELDAHTVVMENLTAAFDTFTDIFADFSPAEDHLASTAAELYKVYCDTYGFAAEAYSNAAFCAVGNALEDQKQAIEDRIRVMHLEAMAARAVAADAVAAKDKAAAFKAKAAEADSKAELFIARARAAETKAGVFLTKAKAAVARAEEQTCGQAM